MSHYKDDEDRRIYPTPDGDFRSVTSYLDELNKPALVPWAAKMSAEYFRDHLALIKSGELNVEAMDINTLVKEAKAHHKIMQEQAMELGSAVHEAVENHFMFKEIVANQEVVGLAAGAVKFITESLGFVVDATEQEVWHAKDGYAGTLDLIGRAKIPGTMTYHPSILDLKTGKAIYPEARMQVAAYAEAWEKKNGGKIKYAMIVRIDKETGKTAEALVMNRPVWKKEYRAFRQLVKFCQARDKAKENSREKTEWIKL